eukprot:7083317-Ditylum_brightwellii.AAC.2
MELQILEIIGKFTEELNKRAIGGQLSCCSPTATEEKDSEDVFVVVEMQEEEGEEISPTVLIYDDADQDAVPPAVKKLKG